MDLIEAVAPFVGVWIEIILIEQKTSSMIVAPFVGVWIEIDGSLCVTSTKYVAPFVGVWIEILEKAVIVM